MLSISTTAEYLEGLEFPVTKAEILRYAEERDAPSDLLDALEDMLDSPDDSYYSIVSVWDALAVIS